MPCSQGGCSCQPQRAGCTGKRDRTAFTALADFSDATLRSDFFLLEGAQRSREAARRSLLKSRDAPASHSQTHDIIREVRAARAAAPAAASTHSAKTGSPWQRCPPQAKRRRVDLLLQPPGMTRRQANTTCFHRHRQSLAWHLEWRFPAADGLVVHSRRARLLAAAAAASPDSTAVLDPGAEAC